MASISINPVNIWNQGEIIICNKLYLRAISDNLLTESVFFYSINIDTVDTSNEVITGNLTCNTIDYENWKQNNFDTAYILNWACVKLNLVPTIILTNKK
jgi:hypothetical protein